MQLKLVGFQSNEPYWDVGVKLARLSVLEWDRNAPERRSGTFLDDRNVVPVLLRRRDYGKTSPSIRFS